MKKPLLFALPLLMFVLLLAMLGTRLGKPTDISTHTMAQRPLPQFSLPLLGQGGQLRSNEDLPKRPFVLNVWGSWCPTCRLEHPFLLALQKQGVTLVGVNYKDDEAAALAYLREHGDPFLYSLQDRQGDLVLDLGLMGAPESFVVDQSGKVWLHVLGELTEDHWRGQIAPCLDALAQARDEPSQVQACQQGV